MAAGASEKPVLHVWGVEADNLAAKDRGNTSDPYAILRLGAQSFQTEVQKTTLDPVWEKNDFRFDGDKTSLASLSPTETKLEVEVWDQNVFTRHELIGRVTVVFEGASSSCVRVRVRASAAPTALRVSARGGAGHRVHCILSIFDP